MQVKKWVEWCDRCGHGFKVDADDALMELAIEEEVPVGFIKKLLGRKSTKRIVKVEMEKPESSPCPVCGKADRVTVIKLQEDHIEDIK